MKPKTTVRGVLFDMDGTVVSVPYDWPRIKADLGSGDVPILSYLKSLDEPELSRKRAILEAYESEATRRAVLKPGMRRFLADLRTRGVKTALITNNSSANAEFLLAKFRLAFDLVMTRESGLWKPSGAPLRAAMRRLGLPRKACCAVGDSHFDVRAARDAGLSLIYVLRRDRERFSEAGVEVVPTVAVLRKRLEPMIRRQVSGPLG